MNLHRYVNAFAVAVSVATMVVPALCAEDRPALSVSRVEVVLAKQYKSQVATLQEEFAQAGLTNVHFQFARLGQPPQNIGLGRDVPAERAREVIRLALKYNLGVGILLPERLFPPRFVTIASSNYDDTVEFPINQAALAQLQSPDLTTDEFHRLYRTLTTTLAEPKGRY
ncbi:MAG: hypothetical protein Q8L77_15220 [Nitrospirota bacterium]|nr:hypothetical protein [Nitrospirota bacterium]MDP1948843.1 hypothetical protein [Nitrospirota bacterium]MDP2384242.1 hypothetical protein [Nitrospirota bacterium]